MNEVELEILHVITQISILRRQLRYSKTKHLPAHHGQLPLLLYIHHHTGCTQTELAEHFSVSPATIATSTKRMEKSELIKKENNPENLRQNQLFLTTKGQDAMLAGKTIFEQIDHQMFSEFSQQEMAVLLKAFCKIRDSLQLLEETT